jgi:hypothetical protein
MKPTGMNQDFLDVLGALVDCAVDFVVVGAHALAVHGIPRATGDIDIFVRPSMANARRVISALQDFGAPVEAHGVSETDFATRGYVYQIGLPPRRIDILTEVSGLSFDEVWRTKVPMRVGDIDVFFIGREAMIKNKRASGRTKDLADVEALEGD